MTGGSGSAPSTAEFLRRVPLLSDLEEPVLAELERASYRKRVPKGTYLFFQSDPADAFYLVRSGSIAIVLTSRDGRELVINEMRPGDCLGEVGLLTGQLHSAGAMARVESEVLVVPRRAFLGLLKAEPRLVHRLLETTARRLVSSAEREGALAFLDAEARVARVLIEMNLQDSDKGYVTVSQEELAQRAGLTRQTAARILSRWRRRGWVVTGRGRIMVLNDDQLEQVSRRGQS
jgi:CRP-like cAMP-binding protein